MGSMDMHVTAVAICLLCVSGGVSSESAGLASDRGVYPPPALLGALLPAL